MQKPVIWLAFKLNQQYIYENFCEQKEKPITVCGGNCQLEKISQQQEKNQKEVPELRIKDFSFLPGASFNQKKSVTCLEINWLPFVGPLKIHQVIIKIFHPPRFISAEH